MQGLASPLGFATQLLSRALGLRAFIANQLAEALLHRAARLAYGPASLALGPRMLGLDLALGLQPLVAGQTTEAFLHVALEFVKSITYSLPLL